MSLHVERCFWSAGLVVWLLIGVATGIHITHKQNPLRDCKPRMIKMYANNLVEIICAEPSDESDSKR